MTYYNPGKFFKPAIDSILNQTYNNFEFILLNDGSNDGSDHVASQYNDNRVRNIACPTRMGRTGALNYALRAAKGEFIAILDADDICDEYRLELQINFLEQNTDVVLVGSECHYIDKKGMIIGNFNPIRSNEEERSLICSSNIIAHSSAMYRRNSALSVGGYPSEYAYAQDYGLWIRLCQIGAIKYMNQPLTSLRTHFDQMSVIPEYVYSRNYDVIRILREAQKLHSLDTVTKAKNREAYSRECLKYAKNLVKNRSALSAIGWILTAFFTDPLSAARSIVAHYKINSV